MAGRYGPNIITDNLKLYVDAANKESYPQTGTTWTDLSGEGNDGTISGATLSSENSKNSVTGGTITNDGEYIIHSFTNDSASENFITDVALTADVLIIAGGGGGGMDMGGGGGAGGLIYRQGISISAGTNAIVVGSGGAGAPAASTGGQPSGHEFTVNATAGEDTTAFGYTADGGGYGGSARWNGTNNSISGSAGGVPSSGGSGGGASGYGYTGNGDNGTNYLAGGAVSTAGQGNAGGQGRVGYYSGGGGGASEAGWHYDISSSYAEGGDGIQINIDGNNYYWAGGGGGGAYSKDRGGHGGEGGGGGGAVGTTTGGSGINAGSAGGGGTNYQQTVGAGGDAGANTGGGGGGGAHYNNSANKGGAGGSGIVIVRYHRSFAPRRFYLNFDDTTAVARWSSTPSPFDTQTAVTVAIWVRLGTNTVHQSLVLEGADSSANNSCYMLRSYASQVYGWSITNSSGSAFTSVTTASTADQWQYVVATFNGTTDSGGQVLYVDGVEKVSTTAATATMRLDTDYGFSIGGDRGTRYGLIDGDISQVKIYNRALSSAEILQNYNVHKGRFGL
jgi:hypothetical protein